MIYLCSLKKTQLTVPRSQGSTQCGILTKLGERLAADHGTVTRSLTGVEDGIEVQSRLLKQNLTKIENQEASISRTLAEFEMLRTQLSALLGLQESLDR